MDHVAELIEKLEPGSRIERAWPLTGGVSASVVAVAFVRPDGARERVVVRRHRELDWKPGPPGRMAREFELMTALHARGLAVPRPRLFDAPDTLVMDHVEGTSDLPADVAARMADALARIHATELQALPALPALVDPRPELDGWLHAEPGLDAALGARGPFLGPPRLLHGDFWPGNLLWRHGHLAAVLDWEDAAVGDPLADVACARAELTCAAGEVVARDFTEAYLRATGLDAARLPVWDLYVSTAALRSMDAWGLAPEQLEHRRVATTSFLRAARSALCFHGV